MVKRVVFTFRSSHLYQGLGTEVITNLLDLTKLQRIRLQNRNKSTEFNGRPFRREGSFYTKT